jgi:hypothetical protein
MMRTIGQGLVLNAIVEAGFANTYDHFDLARFKLADGAGEISLDVTTELVRNPQPQNLAKAVRESNGYLNLRSLPLDLAQLASTLAEQGCMVLLPDPRQYPDEVFPGGACVHIERTDVFSSQGSDVLAIKVKVRAVYRS